MNKCIIKIEKKYKKVWFGVVAIFCFVIFWQLIAVLFSNYNLLPSPATVAQELIRLFLYNDFFSDVIVSLKRVLIGVSLASLVGVTLGVFSGINKIFSRLLKPVIEIIRPIPPIAWIPLAILWFGLGDNPAYFLVFLGSFFPVFSNTYLGVILIEEKYIKAAYTLGATNRQIIFEVVLPGALPNILAGIKVGMGVGWMALIAAELVGSQSGLGYFIQMNRVVLDITRVIAGMVMIGIVGFSLNCILSLVEKIILPWKHNDYDKI